MYVCVYVSMYVCNYVCMCVCMYVYVCIMFVCIYVCMCVYVCIYLCTYVLYGCMCVRTYVCMYACMYICVCVRIMYSSKNKLLALKFKWGLPFFCSQRNYLAFLLRASVRAVLLNCARRSK